MLEATLMRILLVNKRAPFEGRGAEQVIWRIGKRFAEEGHRVRFFCPSPTTDAAIPEQAGIEFQFVDTSDDHTRSMIQFFLQGPLCYRRTYQEFQPDVVYDNPSPFPFHLAHVYGDAPVLTKVHAIYRRLAFDCKDHPFVQIGTILGEESYRFFRNDHFVTNSKSTAERLQSLVDTDRNKITENPIGIDPDRFDFNIPESGTGVLTISKLSPRKRVSDLLRAWKCVEADYPEASLKLAGSGPLAGDLRALAKELGLDQVEFLGFVSESRKHQLLHDAAIFVSPTLYEGFGLANLEAMASGCAVVSTDTWGVKDYVVDGSNGLLVPPKSPKEVGRAVSRLLSKNEVRTRIAQSGGETATKYPMDRSLSKELAILDKHHS